MTRTVRLARHELRFLALDTLLVYVRFDGDLVSEEARSLAQHIGLELAGRRGRLLVDATRLGAIGPGSRRELFASGPDPSQCGSRILDILVVGASLRQKVVMMQLVSTIGLPVDSPGQTLFFEALDDALRWLDLPAAVLAPIPPSPPR